VPARPRRGALGLRGRIVGVVLVTTVATLAVAALALLGPLEQSLRNAALKTLTTDLREARATSILKKLDPSTIADFYLDPSNAAQAPLYEKGLRARQGLLQQEGSLAARIGAIEVNLLGYPDASGHAQPIITPVDSDTAHADPYDDVARAFRIRHAVYSFGSINGTDYARAALLVTTPSGHWVLAVRKPIDQIPGAVRAVRTAFLTAALAGLALTLILAIPLAATVVRRLRRLRQAALQLAREGPAVEVPVDDRARDEVGDLARTFAIMQRRLQQQEQARRAFVATASHELRTPLTSLDGMLELLDDDLRSGEPDLEDARSLLERARVQSRRLGRLAADLLDLSRIDAEVQLRSEPVELGELSRAVLAEFELGTAERALTPVLDESAGPVWALGDPGSVARILRILLDNAVRVSPDGAEIRVSLRNEPGAVLSVCDVGPGVPPEERDLIFERFQRGRGAGGQAGFGLGLAIGRELAERMGGELVLDESDGPGAMFTLRLPVAHAPEEDPVAVA
jgi:signal transduction histidine kinase